MEIIFWSLVSLILYTYIGYPLVLSLIALFINNKVTKQAITPKVTLLISAYNEEKSIQEKINNTLKLDYPSKQLEIIVASDGSTDETDNIVKKFHPQGVKLLRIENRLGKTSVQNEALKIATGEIVIFSDATTLYERQVIKKIVRNYADAEVGAVSGVFSYTNPQNTANGLGTIKFWNYENFIKQKQNQIKTISGCCGCIYSVRKSLYQPLPGDIISDLVEPLSILKKGYRIALESEAIAFEKSLEKSKHEFKMRIRVISRGMHGLLYMKQLFNPYKFLYISFQLFSHKVLRWLIPFFCIALFIVNVLLVNTSLFYLFTFIMQITFYLTALLGLVLENVGRKFKLLSLPLYFCIINIASMISLVRTLIGKKDVTWETVRE